MALEAGTRLGPYSVTEQIGAGGMGEVYRARDTKLDRDVALKILPEDFASDPERLARFQREAKVLASLNHPNIAQIHGLEDSTETRALVLELVPGPTLQDRIAKGPIPLDEALPIARQIAEALEAAHEQGIIHRDLKPANVKVRSDGTVKVLDFGLAKALQPELSDLDAANSPTMTMTAAATKMGVIMGTAAYMSPEQARGKQVDKRADIWAFGVVLFEMLTGRQAFTGGDVSDVLVSIFRDDPDWASLPKDTPARIRQTLRVCLQKDTKQRVRDVSAIRLAMEGAFEASESEGRDRAETPVAPPVIWQRPVAVAALLLAAIVITGLTVLSLAPAPSIPVVRMRSALGPDERFTGMGRHAVGISGDGSYVVYTTTGGLALRQVSELQATLIAGTGEGGNQSGRSPVFSPDGEWVAYYQQGELRKVAVGGGAPVTLCEAVNPYGISWETDDTILYGQGVDGIWRVSAAGSPPEQLTAVGGGTSEDVNESPVRQEAHGPQMLPDGEAVLYTLSDGGRQWDVARIVVEELATGDRTVLVDGGRDGRYLPTGHLAYVLNGVLFAVPFDPAGRTVTGAPVPLVVGIRDAGGTTGATQFSVADTGTLVYIQAGDASNEQLVWVDRTGQTEPVGPEPQDHGTARVSPDGSRLAVDTVVGGNYDISIYDLSRATMSRLTFNEEFDANPLWTPDGSRVVFFSERDGSGLFWKAADGSGEVERLLGHREVISPLDWTPDGRVVVQTGPGDVGVVTIEDGGTLEMLLDTESFEGFPHLSPDGRWLAYTSDESGALEVYVRSFPDLDGKWQVSTEGGKEPLWSPDGRELFFIGGGKLWAVQVETEATFVRSMPESLFDVTPFEDVIFRGWDITPDGERFLFGRSFSEQVVGGNESFVFVQNWFSELQARVPTGG